MTSTAAVQIQLCARVRQGAVTLVDMIRERPDPPEHTSAARQVSLPFRPFPEGEPWWVRAARRSPGSAWASEAARPTTRTRRGLLRPQNGLLAATPSIQCNQLLELVDRQTQRHRIAADIEQRSVSRDNDPATASKISPRRNIYPARDCTPDIHRHARSHTKTGSAEAELKIRHRSLAPSFC